MTARWLAWKEDALGAVTTDDTVKRLERHVLKRFGDKPIAELTKADVKAILDTLQAEGKYQTLKKVRNNLSQILRYAIDQEIPGVEIDWTQPVHRQYANLALREKHRAAITTPKEIAGLMKAIDAYAESNRLTHLALLFSALTFCRPGEVRKAEWTEIDWDNRLVAP